MSPTGLKLLATTNKTIHKSSIQRNTTRHNNKHTRNPTSSIPYDILRQNALIIPLLAHSKSNSTQKIDVLRYVTSTFRDNRWELPLPAFSTTLQVQPFQKQSRKIKPASKPRNPLTVPVYPV